MRQRRLAWILLPAAIVILAVFTFVVSNYQKEAGIAAPGKGGVAAVAAVAEATTAASGAGAIAYDAFSKSLAVAIVEARNMATTNPAETRLQIDLTKTLDCLSASREAWQTEIDQSWDPAVDGSPGYWRTMHPALIERAAGPLSSEQVREWSGASADYWLQKAVDLAE
jgi:hypothetical protein